MVKYCKSEKHTTLASLYIRILTRLFPLFIPLLFHDSPDKLEFPQKSGVDTEIHGVYKEMDPDNRLMEKKAYFCERTGVSQRRDYRNYPRLHCYHWHLSDSSVYMVHQGGAKKEAEGLQPLLITHCGTLGRFLWRTVCLAPMFKCICPRLTHKENYHVLSCCCLSFH